MARSSRSNAPTRVRTGSTIRPVYSHPPRESRWTCDSQDGPGHRLLAARAARLRRHGTSEIARRERDRIANGLVTPRSLSLLTREATAPSGATLWGLVAQILRN